MKMVGRVEVPQEAFIAALSRRRRGRRTRSSRCAARTHRRDAARTYGDGRRHPGARPDAVPAGGLHAEPSTRTRVGHGDARFEAAVDRHDDLGVQRAQRHRRPRRSTCRPPARATTGRSRSTTTASPSTRRTGTPGPTSRATRRTARRSSPPARRPTLLDARPYGRTRRGARPRRLRRRRAEAQVASPTAPLDGHPESGEESWVVDQTEDGSVWLSIRVFSRPSTLALAGSC